MQSRMQQGSTTTGWKVSSEITRTHARMRGAEDVARKHLLVFEMCNLEGGQRSRLFHYTVHPSKEPPLQPFHYATSA